MKFALVLLASLLSYSSTSLACSCARVSFAEAYRSSQAVFIGHVLNSTDLSNQETQNWRFDARVKVIAGYKGVRQSVVSITSEGIGSCGARELTAGQTILFLADRENGKLKIGPCNMHTGLLESSTQAIQRLPSFLRN